MLERREPRIGAIEATSAANDIPILTERAAAPDVPDAELADLIVERVLEKIEPALREAIAATLAELAPSHQSGDR